MITDAIQSTLRGSACCGPERTGNEFQRSPPVASLAPPSGKANRYVSWIAPALVSVDKFDVTERPSGDGSYFLKPKSN
ncbi:hypothetical protein CA85_24530 [Allorhodopirellula solitaria]|uniref:Uncharacterized protein n=1 Tax=Allorhodopirellula solitaria TaxID=2527987 RepID=A0A5C5XV35_9BACT|nr:hypothetical protein CA85_24530 [Allorhodopirellula solitaria]